MKWFTHIFIGRQNVSPFGYPQHYLNFYLVTTAPVFTCLFRFCTNEDKEIKILPKSYVTQATHSNRNLTLRAISDEKVEGTVTKHNNAMGTEKMYMYSGIQLKSLAKLLHCSVNDMQVLVSKYSFFTHLSPELIKEKINIMLFYGLPYSFMSANPRLLYQTSATELKRRLQQFRDHSFLSENSVVTLENLAHYLECRNDQFDWTFKKLCAEKKALEGCYDQTAYIQFRLSVTKEQAQQLLHSYPLQRHLSNTKLKEVLDFFLIETKLGAEFYIKHRKLSMFSIVRLRARWRVIVSEGITSEAKMLYIWNISEEMFNNTYKNNVV
ncbi:unnamed protein product [Candidula unifasciata]|uniref:Uncharacterized protein n=1 Tax=Candidula unifasciata TaxID=100452 RepID=A0A8S3ZDK5_9EUPU|nr:unnamed protein product [Candidula unifasciata]